MSRATILRCSNLRCPNLGATQAATAPDVRRQQNFAAPGPAVCRRNLRVLPDAIQSAGMKDRVRSWSTCSSQLAPSATPAPWTSPPADGALLIRGHRRSEAPACIGLRCLAGFVSGFWLIVVTGGPAHPTDTDHQQSASGRGPGNDQRIDTRSAAFIREEWRASPQHAGRRRIVARFDRHDDA
jgi:hypothetical protein